MTQSFTAKGAVAYEARPCLGGRSGQCAQQVTPVIPIEWQNDSDAFALLGDTRWANYTVSSDVYLNQAGTVELYGRANTQQRPQGDQAAYHQPPPPVADGLAEGPVEGGRVPWLKEDEEDGLGVTVIVTVGAGRGKIEVLGLCAGTWTTMPTTPSAVKSTNGLGQRQNDSRTRVAHSAARRASGPGRKRLSCGATTAVAKASSSSLPSKANQPTTASGS